MPTAPMPDWLMKLMGLAPPSPMSVDNGVADPSRVYTKDGRQVYDSHNVGPDGRVPTHALNAVSGRKPGESWEDYEKRVVGRKVWSSDTARIASIGALEPDLQEKFLTMIADAQKQGIFLRIGETRRRTERQEYLFQQGRGRPGPVVTWTLTSGHQSGRAADLQPVAPSQFSGYKWIQENAPKYGFSVMGNMDPGHVEAKKDSSSKQFAELFVPHPVANNGNVVAAAAPPPRQALQPPEKFDRAPSVASVADAPPPKHRLDPPEQFDRIPNTPLTLPSVAMVPPERVSKEPMPPTPPVPVAVPTTHPAHAPQLSSVLPVTSAADTVTHPSPVPRAPVVTEPVASTGLHINDMLDDPLWRQEMERTAAGRQELRRLDAQRQKEEIEQSVAQSKQQLATADPATRQRLEESIASQSKGAATAGSVVETGRYPARTDQNAFDSALGGALTGAARGAATALPDLAQNFLFAPANALTGGALRGASDEVAQIRAKAEELFQPRQGAATSVGEFAGGTLASMPFLGPLARAASAPVASVVERVGAPLAADAIRAAGGVATKLGTAAPGRLAQGAANVAAGLPFQVLQQVGMEGASAKDRLKAAAQSTLADFGFGSVFAQKPGSLLVGHGQAAPTPEAPTAPAPGSAAEQALNKLAGVKAATEAEKAAKDAAKKIQRNYERKASDEAVVIYRQENPKGKAWPELTKDEKKEWIDKWKAANPMEVASAPAPVATPAPVVPTPDAIAAPAITPPKDVLTGEPLPSVPATKSYVMPEEVAKSAPRYGYGSKQFTLKFEDDLDRAAYILQGTTKSAGHDKILADAVQQTGLTEAALKERGKQLKAQIKERAKNAPAGEMVVPAKPTDVFVPSPTVGMAPKARKVKVDGGTEPLNIGPVIPGLDDVAGAPMPTPAPAPPPRVVGERTPVEDPFVPVVEPVRGTNLDTSTPPIPEKIVQAAIRTPDGTVFTSYDHGSALQLAEDAGKIKPDEWDKADRSLFATNTGRIVTHEEASRISGAPDPESYGTIHQQFTEEEFNTGLAPAAPGGKVPLEAYVREGRTPPSTPEVVPPAPPQGDARAWWNSMAPGSPEREAWLRHGGWEPTGPSRVAMPNARYDALSTKALEAVKSAHEAFLRGETPAPVVAKVEPTPVAPTVKIPTKPELATRADGTTFTYDWSKARRPGKMEAGELTDYLAETQRRADLAELPATKDEYLRVVEKIKDRLTDVKLAEGPPPPPPGSGVRLQSHGAIGGGLVGMTTGITQEDPDDPNYYAKLAAWSLVGAAGGYGVQKWGEARGAAVAHKAPSEIPEFTTGKMLSLDETKGGPKPLTERLRDFYVGGVRSVANSERVLEGVAAYSPEHARNVQRNLGIFGHWISNTEQALTDRLVMRDTDVNSPTYGEPIYIKKDKPGEADHGGDIKSPKQILADVGGDMEGLGRVAIAFRVIENDSRGITKHPIDLEEARRIAYSAPDHMVQAVKDLRDFHLGIAQMLMRQGRLTREGYEAMRQQEFYTPFYYKFESGQLKSLDPFDQQHVGTPDPLKAQRKGAQLPVANPFEQTLVLTPRFMRAIEWGQLTQSVVDMGRQIGDTEVKNQFVRRVGWNELNAEQKAALKEIEGKAKETAQQLGLQAKDITGLVSDMTADHPAFQGGYFTNWENGVLVTYKTNEAMFSGMKSLLPMERDLVTGLFSKVGSMLSRGVVNSPVFLFNQLFKDSFEAATMSRHGFRPLIDSAIALKHIYSRSNEYLRLLDLGGPGTIQSLRYLDPAKALTSIRAEGGNAAAIAWQQMKEMHPIEAYKTLAQPLAEAARVGEYLRALKHGETPIEAVYSAWNVLGNTRIQGASPIIRKMNAITPFMRASISAMDELGARSGLNAMRRPDGGVNRTAAFLGWAGRGVMSLVLPTLTLRAAEYVLGGDDEELRNIRNTSVGQRYWFIRPSTFLGKDAADAMGLGEGIIRIPRPHASGILFAAATDAAIDKVMGKDPVAWQAWSKALVDQTWINTVPTVGVILAGMVTGKQIGAGPDAWDITRPADQKLAPDQQGATTASLPARIVGGTLGKAPGIGSMFSPPMVDFLMRSVGGMAAQDLTTAMTLVSDYVDKGHVPAKYELPVVRQFFVNQNTTNVAPVEKFYRYADRAEGVYNAAQAMAQRDPKAAVAYMKQNMDVIKYASLLSHTRDEIAQYRKAAADIKQMPREYATPERRKALQKVFAQRMIESAAGVVGVIEHKPGGQ